ncbi:hypothetical protein JVU11DRAFT_5908 [Chiua virens]|nr:hypothetical protein JVU11DRAFT_5908 [Chiua virens]
MEGFTIQGMRGTLQQVLQRITRSKITGKPKASMQWTHYFWNVVFRHKVIIEAWPSSIPFVNLSKASSALAQLEMLL